MLLKALCGAADRATIILLKADLRRAGRIRYTGRRVCVRGVVCASGASCVRQGRRVCVRGVVCASGASCVRQGRRRSDGAAERRSGVVGERRSGGGGRGGCAAHCMRPRAE
jgi:hypothetical protein